MNKKIFFGLSLIFIFKLGFADIYQASKWINEEGKTITVYHDNHVLCGNESQLNYLYNNIFTKFEENKPGRKLLVLSECTAATLCGRQTRKLCSPEKSCNSSKIFIYQFRKMFNKKIKKYLKRHNVDIINIENREYLMCLKSYFSNRIFLESTILTNYFSNKTLKQILHTIYGHLFEHIENSTNELVQAHCSIAVEYFEKTSQNLVDNLINLNLSVNTINVTPFVEIGHSLIHGNQFQQSEFALFIGSLQNYFLEIIETNVLINIFLSEPNQDIAIFVGGLHAMKIEEELPRLGYECIKMDNAHYIPDTEVRVVTIKPLVSTPECFQEFVNSTTASFIPISNEVFNWILE